MVSVVAILIPTQAYGAEPKAEDIAEAKHFRQTVGFEDGNSFVRDTFEKPARYSADDWGVPLSRAESDELYRRSELQAKLDNVREYAAGLAGYAGMYVDHQRGGIPVFRFTQDGASHRSQLANRMPNGTEFDTQGASRTHKQLRSLQDSVEAAVKELDASGISIVRAAIQPSKNKVVVGVENLTDAKIATMEERFGPGLLLQDDVPAVADYCNDDENCWPPMGGIQIAPSFNINRYCTSGYMAKRNDNGNQVLITAGHCVWANQGVEIQWEHDNHNLGKAKTKVFANWADADVGIIGLYGDTLDDLNGHAKNRYMKGPAGPTIKNLVGTLAGSSQAEGFLVCRMGARTGKKCGTIVKEIGSNKSRATNYAGTTVEHNIKHTIEVSFDSKGGDSGGPVFSNSGVDGIGYGLHVHSDDETEPIPPGQSGYRGWYVAIDWAKSALADNGWPITWCKTTSC